MSIGILEQRRIEAAFARGIYEEMAAALGPEQARAILSRAIVKLAKEAAAAMAAEAPDGPSLDHFIAIQERWTRNCIDGGKSCTGGDLGDGDQLRMVQGYVWPNGRPLEDAPVP